MFVGRQIKEGDAPQVSKAMRGVVASVDVLQESAAQTVRELGAQQRSLNASDLQMLLQFRSHHVHLKVHLKVHT